MEILTTRRFRRPLKSRRTKLLYQTKRRDLCRDNGWCVNGEHHGKATKGVRCDNCDSVHRRSA